MPGRRPTQQLHGYVSAEARDGWYRFAEANDTNVTALLEAVGTHLAGLAATRAKLPKAFEEIASEARRIAGQRSSRRTSAD